MCRKSQCYDLLFLNRLIPAMMNTPRHEKSNIYRDVKTSHDLSGNKKQYNLGSNFIYIGLSVCNTELSVRI